MTNTEEIIKSWPWRVKRIGMTLGAFCEGVGIPAPTFSQYTTGKAEPPASRYIAIEEALSKMEIEKGFVDA